VRACEFIVEHKHIGKISKRLRYATRGLNKFRDMEFADRVYELNRIGMAVAANNGKEFSFPINGESWAGRNDIAAPYTQQEQDMLNMAYKAVGTKNWDLNNGDMRSQELPAVNTTSPMQAFKGYKR
jgi:nuclear transport factor 2 (NTF2) superfamily protein